MEATQKDKVLKWLRRGHSITPLQALKRFGSLRLGAIIHKLRLEYGNDYIVTERVPVKNRFGKVVYIARYML